MMADDDFISTDNQFLIEYYWEELVKRINISRSTLIDELLTTEVLTQQEGEDLKIKEKLSIGKHQEAREKNVRINDGPVVESLLELILTKTNSHFKGLCEGLDVTGQGFIVKQCLSQHGAKKACTDLQVALAECFSESYKDSMFTYDTEEHQVDLSEIYVPIKWVTREKSTQGVTEKTLKNYHDIFNVESSGKAVKVIVKGEPASGKTTFMRKICKEWSTLHKTDEEPVSSEVRDALGPYDLLIPVILRLVKHGATLEDTIKDQIDLDEKKMLALRYMLKNTERTVLIMDGLDEFHTSTSSHITDIMKGNTFKHIVITSRAEAARKTKEWKKAIYKEASLRGFSNKHIKEYVNKFFKESPEEGTSLISQILKKDSHLLKLARNPGSLCLLCLLYKDGYPIHYMNREQLYQEYVAFLLSRWEQRQNPEGEKTPRSEILKKYHTILLKFGELAYIHNKDLVDCNFDKMELSFTMGQIKSVVREDALNYGFLYRSHPTSLIEQSQYSFLHQTLHEYFLAFYIKHSDIETFKRRFYKNKEFLKQKLSLTRFILHLHMSPKEAHDFTTNFLGSNPSKDLFTSLLKLYRGYKYDKYHTTMTFNDDDQYSYVYQYPCYVICVKRNHQDLLSSFNKDMIRRMNTDNKHKAVTVPLLQAASKQLVTCGNPGMSLNEPDVYVCCRQDYKVKIKGDVTNVKELHLSDIETVQEINLHHANDDLKVDISNTSLHGNIGVTEPWLNLVGSLWMLNCELDPGDLSALADSFQACSSLSAGESTPGCRLQQLVLSYNSLTSSGADIAKIIHFVPLCTHLYLYECGLNDEDFHAIVNAVIHTGPASHLERLYLHNNRLTDIHTVKLLLDNLPPSICVLDLDGNRFPEEESQKIKSSYMSVMQERNVTLFL